MMVPRPCSHVQLAAALHDHYMAGPEISGQYKRTRTDIGEKIVMTPS